MDMRVFITGAYRFIIQPLSTGADLINALYSSPIEAKLLNRQCGRLPSFQGKAMSAGVHL
jgi:hypothetical protein